MRWRKIFWRKFSLLPSNARVLNFSFATRATQATRRYSTQENLSCRFFRKTPTHTFDYLTRSERVFFSFIEFVFVCKKTAALPKRPSGGFETVTYFPSERDKNFNKSFGSEEEHGQGGTERRGGRRRRKTSSTTEMKNPNHFENVS